MSTKAQPSSSERLDALTCKLEVTFPADQKHIGRVANAVMQVARAMEATNGKEFEIELAVREALANAIVHGCQCDPRKRIEVSVAAQEEGDLLIVIRDPGPGFDPKSLPNPCEERNLLRPHGRGVHLINELMDDVEFVSPSDGHGTEVRMKSKKPL